MTTFTFTFELRNACRALDRLRDAFSFEFDNLNWEASNCFTTTHEHLAQYMRALLEEENFKFEFTDRFDFDLPLE